MNFEFLTALLIKYHILFYYLALVLNVFFVRGGVSIAFIALVGLFWVFCFELTLGALLEKFP